MTHGDGGEAERERLERRADALERENAQLRRELEDRTAALRGSLEEIKRLTKQLQRENRYLRDQVQQPFDEVIGASPAFVRVLEQARRAAPTDATVLLTGETGTGKEVLATLIHRLSRRRHKPLVRVNCAALTDTLVASELFGHEKGAFTGADRRKIGRFELAHGGTIFLDEIGDISPEAQTKLLRVLEVREFDRVGGTETIPADVRVIAATHRDLPAAVAAGRFREDLFYRLNRMPIRLPALRERTEDVPALAEHFLARANRQLDRRFTGLSARTRGALTAYPWPGNIRELQNLIERAAILGDGPELEIDLELLAPQAARTGRPAEAIPIPPPPSPAAPNPAADRQTLEQATRAKILDALRASRWKLWGADGAAARLGLKPTTLQSKIKRLGLTRGDAAALPAHGTEGGTETGTEG
jgi:formate hydrogenlyase transcriptional activator